MAGEWPERRAIDLQNDGLLLVEDGNRGEYRPRREEFGDDAPDTRSADLLRWQIAWRFA